MYMRAQALVIFHRSHLFWKLSVEDNISAVLEMTSLTKEVQKDKLESLLSEFGLHKGA